MTFLPDLMARWFEGGNPAPNTFEDELALGRIRGAYAIHVRGRAPISGTTVEVWGAGTSYTFPSTLATISLSSSDASDSIAGAGARSVLIDGCGNGFERYQEVVPLSGTSVVQSTGSFLRVNHVMVVSAGSHQSNRGGIFAYHNGSLLISQIASGSGEDGNGIYTLPSGTYGSFRSAYVFTGLDATIQVRVQVRPGPNAAWTNALNAEIYRAETFIQTVAPALPPTSDLRISTSIVKAGSVSAGNVSAGCFLVAFDPTFDDLEPK